jgi:hypothetical protein
MTPMRGELRPIAEGMWVAEHKLRFYGTPIVTRMTVLRRSAGALVVHSPVRLSPELRASIDALGPVETILAPNRFHHVFVTDFVAAYPGARLFGARGLVKKRKDLTFHGLLGDEPAPEWTREVQPLVLDGAPTLGEVVFFHPPTRTLLVSDLFFNYRPAKSLAVRLVRKLEDCDGKFCVGRLIKLTIRDRAAFAASVDRMLAWDFDRVVMAHGEVMSSGGKEAVRLALGWLR